MASQWPRIKNFLNGQVGMSQSFQLAFHELVVAEPPVVLKLTTLATTDRSSVPARVQDWVTLSQEALALSSPTESPLQQLEQRGYSLSQIAFDLAMTLTEVESDLGIETFSVAA